MGSFTYTLALVTDVLGQSPNVSVIGKPEIEFDATVALVRQLAIRLVDGAGSDEVNKLLGDWIVRSKSQDKFRNPCRLGQIVQLVNAGLVGIDLLNQVNSAWSKIFYLFNQYHYVVHPQYYFVCEIDSLNVSLEVLPGVMTEENIAKLVRTMIAQGKSPEAAGLLTSLVS